MVGRPKPQVLIKSIDPNNADYEITIIAAKSYWVITYRDEPINIVIQNVSPQSWTNPKRYGKLAYPQKGHCIRKAKTLNKLFNTQDFNYKEIKMELIPQNGPGPIRVPSQRPPVPNPIPGKFPGR